jgi:cholesterol oxidase
MTTPIRLSRPPGELRDRYDVVVVGSGYGGGIAASRLARAGRQVCLLERGKEFQAPDYPNTMGHFIEETQWDLPAGHIGSETGLYDLRFNDDINVFLGCGLGGTSLINAGVSLRVEPSVLDDERWPAAIRKDLNTGRGANEFGVLDEYYRCAETMLKPNPFPHSRPMPPKMAALEYAASALNLPFSRVPINVTFDALPGGLNHVGVQQNPCVACGDCGSGCNYGAKNTVLMNYLPDAKNHGAAIHCNVSVRSVEQHGDEWLVRCRRTDGGSAQDGEIVVQAAMVILAAGTLGSTEILLRSRERGLKVSEAIGTRFSGNGDLVGWTYNSTRVINGFGFGNRSPDGRLPVGPWASGIIDARKTDGFVIIEGAFPGAMARSLPLLFATADIAGVHTRPGFLNKVKEKIRILMSLVSPYMGATMNTQTYLVVNHDDSGGRIHLADDRVRVSWPGIGNAEIFEQSRERLRRMTAALEGTFITTLKWNNMNEQVLLTGHPTGGCAMADEAAAGVVNDRGQVFKGALGSDVHAGLYVMDGAIIPRSIGVNPLLTISALAERCCRLLAADRGWHIDYSFPRARPN